MRSKSDHTSTSEQTSHSFKNFAAKAKQAAAKASESVLKTVDKNGNGKIDAEDFGITGESIQIATQRLKTGANHIGETLSEARTERERKTLRPVFMEDLYSNAFGESSNDTVHLPELISIVAHDRKHAESAVCSGSIGYLTGAKDADLLNLYEDVATQFEISFLPDMAQTIYYRDPYRNNVYVRLDSYFSYLKKNRVSELELIAQSLGAQSFRVAFREHQSSTSSQAADIVVNIGKNTENVSAQKSQSEKSKVEIAAETQFDGHNEPKIPSLVYFKNEDDIQKLIQMRMDRSNPIRSKDFHFQCIRSAGMTEKTAAKIYSILLHMRRGVAAAFSNEIQREGRTELEYHIEF